MSFGIVVNFDPDLDSFHFVRIARQAFFMGEKKAMSSGCVRCLEFGRRHTNFTLCWSHRRRTLTLMWEDKLFPMITLVPSKCLTAGKKID